MTYIDADDAWEQAREEKWREPPSERRFQLANGAMPDPVHDEATSCRLDSPEMRELRRRYRCDQLGIPYAWPTRQDLPRLSPRPTIDHKERAA